MPSPLRFRPSARRLWLPVALAMTLGSCDMGKLFGPA
jgi:hypothetical protein